MSDKNLLLRNDTLLGVCKGLGEDFGFNPTFLRVALILPLFWFPVEMVAIYLALGVVVFASRALFPIKDRRSGADLKLAQVDGSAEVVPAIESEPLRNAA
ncbi:PspC domain-containing protein [Sphingomicrobium sp. XHP0235]|uniref:PspC domain-containing protein n=1 Tax=Sphingomicrobium aquimarinum TaxID=3133971 RepID=UPI0031FE6C80